MCEIIATFHYFIRVKIIIIDCEMHSEIDKVLNEKNADCENIYSDLRQKLHKNALLMHSMESFLKEANEMMCIEKY